MAVVVMPRNREGISKCVAVGLVDNHAVWRRPEEATRRLVNGRGVFMPVDDDDDDDDGDNGDNGDNGAL